MQTRWIDEEFRYTGEQLHSLFAYMRFGVLGDSVVSWRGPCEVGTAHMVDGEDLRAQAVIAGSDMIHFIVEVFHLPLQGAVLLQRLMTAIAMEYIQQHGNSSLTARLVRKGDDLFIGSKKLNISIATCSPTSSLIHSAYNVSNEGTPVETVSLNDLSLDPESFALAIMTALSNEWGQCQAASRKVKWVR